MWSLADKTSISFSQFLDILGLRKAKPWKQEFWIKHTPNNIELVQAPNKYKPEPLTIAKKGPYQNSTFPLINPNIRIVVHQPDLPGFGQK